MPGSKTSGRPGETKQLKIKGPQGPPSMPKNLGLFARRIWEDAVAALPHVLQPLDYAILLGCCESFQLFMDLKDGDLKERQQAISALARFESLAGKIGLTPHSRRVIKPVDVETTDDNDPYADWLQRGGLN